MTMVGCDPSKSVVTLASTTSTEDSGLFSVLAPAFEEDNPDYELRVIAVGTGEALELGRRKDADILLVHAPISEIEFIESGHGVNRKEVMRNDFVLLGPSDDPVGIASAADSIDALEMIAKAESDYVSRGDESGTHKKETSLWDEASVQPPFEGDWFISTGQGMGNSLTIASEKQAYILSDKATYLTRQDNLELSALFQGGSDLSNFYSVIEVTDASETEGAKAFSDWITSAAGKSVISGFGSDEFTEPLFIPTQE